MSRNTKAQFIAQLLTAISLVWLCGPAAAATRIEGQVQGGGAPIANSTVTLWGARSSAPSQLAQVKTDANGRFEISVEQSPDKDTSLYLVAAGGEPAANKAGGDNPAIGLMAVLGNTPPAKVTINEFTTVASVWPHNQFLDGTASVETGRETWGIAFLNRSPGEQQPSCACRMIPSTSMCGRGFSPPLNAVGG